jgi:hypothetical protein
MSWHYQVMRHTAQTEDGDIEVWYAVHEYFELAGEDNGWTEDPVNVSGMDKQDIEWALKTMLQDVQSRGIRDYETGEKLE